MGQIVLPPVPGISYNRVVFLSSGTFTLPKSAFNKFDCVLVSGGGGGAGANNTNPRKSLGGSGCAAYFHDIFCTNETTLTVTVGAGGAGGAAATNGTPGTESTITGLAGNGVATSLSSGNAKQGVRSATSDSNGNISPQVGRNLTNNGGSYAAKGMAAGFGFGVTAFSSGFRNSSGYAGYNSNIFGSNLSVGAYITGTVANSPNFQRGGTGGPVPLLGSLLHATAGGTGTTGQSAGGISTANSYFAGAGGGSQYGSSGAGFGGGGGAGGQSNNSSISSGSGGAGSVNSGGGGGAGGQNQAGGSLLGVGGNGGSGFVVIGYWG